MPQSLRLQPHKRQAFTTVELLVVIAVLAILIGFLFVAGRRLITSNRASSTRVTLANLQGMLADLEASQAGRLTRQPAVWLWTENGTTFDLVPPGVAGWTHNFWVGPSIPGPAITFDPLEVCGYVDSDRSDAQAVNWRNGSIAVINTSLAMTIMASIPANGSRLRSMPQDQIMHLEWSSGTLSISGADRFTHYGSDSSGTVRYAPGTWVKYKDRLYVANNDPSLAANPTPVAGAPGPAWRDQTEAGRAVPLLKDAWSNPIIFVPGSGLRVLLLNGRSRYGFQEATPTDYPEQRFIIISPEGEVTNNGSTTTAPQVVRAGRPFFASAGPDGDFSTGDDNIYSFEK